MKRFLILLSLVGVLLGQSALKHNQPVVIKGYLEVLLDYVQMDTVEVRVITVGGVEITGTDDQTIDVFSISGNNIQLSLENDGEATKTVDVSSTTAVTANSAKVTNATHTGEVTGSGVLTIDNDALDDQYFDAHSDVDHNQTTNYVAELHFYQEAIDSINTGLTGVIRADSGVLSVDTDVSDLVTETDPIWLADSSQFAVIAHNENISGAYSFTALHSLTNELDLTGANVVIDINSAGQGDSEVINITPTATLNATSVWHGVHVDGSALDPNGADAEIVGLHVDFSGVDETNNPIIHGMKIESPFGQDAIDVEEGQIHISTVLPNTVGAEFTSIDVVIDALAIVASSQYHAIDVAVGTGSPSGDIVALGTHAYVAPIHQHIESFSTPTQADYAGRKTGGGASWADAIDGIEVFVVNSDEIYLGNTAGAGQFSAVEVIMGTPSTKQIQFTSWYNTAADSWTQFFPQDDTEGLQQSGLIRWNLDGITASWTNNGDPGGANSETGYWIKFIRTSAPDPGTPTPTTMKTGISTEYYWDETGDILANNIAGTTYGSNESVSDAELLYINSLSSNAQTQISTNAGLVDTDDKLIAIINASPSTQISVAAGGTGVGTLNDGGLLVGATTGAVEVLADGLTTQVLVGGGSNVNPVWGTDLPTALTIGSGYIYRAGGTDVPDGDVADNITLDSTKVDDQNFVPDAEFTTHKTSADHGGQYYTETEVDNIALTLVLRSAVSDSVKEYIDDTAYNATSWDGNDEAATKNAIRDKIEGLPGTGTMTTVKENNVGVGDADIVVIDFLGADFNLAETPNTEIQIVIEDGGIDHDATANFDTNEHYLQSAIVATSALNSGSITNGFGVIDIGADNFTATGTISLGATSFNDNNITNVGQLSIDELKADGAIVINVTDSTDFSDDVNIAGTLAIGTTNPDGKVHIYSATAGAVEAAAAADELVLENSDSGGMSILVPDASDANIYFGSLSDNIGAIFRWEFNTKVMRIGTANTTGTLNFTTANGVSAITIDENQAVDFTGTTINMVASGTTLTVGVGADNGTVSAGVFTDRTPFYDGDALKDIKKIKGNNGKIDHKSLPVFVQVDKGETTERNIGNMISVNVRALQQLIDVVDDLTLRLEKLE